MSGFYKRIDPSKVREGEYYWITLWLDGKSKIDLLIGGRFYVPGFGHVEPGHKTITAIHGPIRRPEGDE